MNNEDIKGIDLKIWKDFTRHPRLGEILLKQKRITISQLGMALEIQENKNLPIGEILIDIGVITKNELIEALELQLRIDKILSDSFNEMKKLKNNEPTNMAD